MQSTSQCAAAIIGSKQPWRWSIERAASSRCRVNGVVAGRLLCGRGWVDYPPDHPEPAEELRDRDGREQEGHPRRAAARVGGEHGGRAAEQERTECERRREAGRTQRREREEEGRTHDEHVHADGQQGRGPALSLIHI
eukprot:1278078-Prymnesium_polylepis.1